MTPAIMTYDDDDRISGWQSGTPNITPVFDANGNMTSGPLEGVSDSFVYDSRNRLTQAGTATTYTYDAEDRRISKTEGGVSTTYVHDPHGALSRLLQKTTGGVTTYYIYAAGQLLYEETGGVISVYHADSRGSTLAISDSTGSVTNRITYGTYGEIVAASGTLATPFRYNGAFGVQTDNNGLLHMRARYYSPELRRFINADPIRFAGGMNWYAYAGGDPVMALDPTGNFIFPIPIAQAALSRYENSSVSHQVNRFVGTVGGDKVDAFLNEASPVVEASLQGALAYADGFNPFGDPFQNNHYYNPSELGLNYSQAIGMIAFQAEASLVVTGTGFAIGRAQIPGWNNSSYLQKIFFSQTWTTQLIENQALGIAITTAQLGYRFYEINNLWNHLMK